MKFIGFLWASVCVFSLLWSLHGILTSESAKERYERKINFIREFSVKWCNKEDTV